MFLLIQGHVTIVCHSTYFKDCVLLVLKVKLLPSFPTRVLFMFSVLVSLHVHHETLVCKL